MKELAPYYFSIYMYVVMLLTLMKFSEMHSMNGYSVLYKKDDYKPIIFFSVFFILLFGFRPISVFFGDTVMYNASYQIMQTYGTTQGDLPAEMNSDWLFYWGMYYFSQVVDIYYFFVVVMYFYIVMMFNGCSKLDSRHGATLMLFCIGAFSFYGYAVNGIRNGVACSFVIMALASVCKGDRIWPIILSFVAISCHKSTALPLACMFFTYFVRNPKYMFYVWLGAIAVSLLIGESIANLIAMVSFDDRLAEIAQKGEDVANEWGVEMENRFRWDFLLYSAMPIILGWYTLFVRKVYNNTYLILLGTYIYANAFWVIVIRDLFSNRFAYLSWFLYPIVLGYPLLNLPVFEKNHSQKTAWILLAHLGFTTFMWMIGK